MQQARRWDNWLWRRRWYNTKVNKKLYLTIETRITFMHINKKEKCELTIATRKKDCKIKSLHLESWMKLKIKRFIKFISWFLIVMRPFSSNIQALFQFPQNQSHPIITNYQHHCQVTNNNFNNKHNKNKNKNVPLAMWQHDKAKIMESV